MSQKEYRDVNDFTGYDSDDDSDLKYGDLNPLQLASKEGKLDEVKAIVAEGKIDIDENNYNRYCAINLAAEFGKWDVVKFLLENKANIDNYTTDVYHISPLFHAVRDGNEEMCKELLLNGAHINEVYSANHEHLLHLAMRHGHKNLMPLLLEAKANPNAQLPSGRKDTPLSSALLHGHLDLIPIIQKAGGKLPNPADADTKTKGLYGFITVSPDPKASFQAAFEMKEDDGVTPFFDGKSVALGLYGCLRSRKDASEYFNMLLDFDQKNKLDATNTKINLTGSWISLLVDFDDAKVGICMDGVKTPDDEKGFTPYDLAKIKNKQEYIDLLKPLATPETLANGENYATHLGYWKTNLDL